MSHHGLGSKAYKESYPDIEISREWFRCRICKTSVKFMKDPISSHLKTHGLELSSYESQHMREEDWPYHPDYVSVPADGRRESLNSSEPNDEQNGRRSSNSLYSDDNMNDRSSKSTDPWNK